MPPVILDVSGDGETLDLRVGRWSDPFASPLSPENQEWSATHGKWEAFDVSQEPDYVELVGKTLRDIWLLRTEFSTLCGARLQLDSRKLDIVCNGDDVFVCILANDVDLGRGKVYAREHIVRESNQDLGDDEGSPDGDLR